MGQFVSTSLRVDNSNDELINSLIKNEYIHTIEVEKAFRSVDRGFYYSDEEKHHAYRDTAWQSEELHLSAPCVYATVLECLELCPGHTFLNIGSGIGYFNTVAGLLLGRNGVNHGIEINGTLIDFAHKKAEEFKLNSAAIDHHDFCEPIFIQGNACELLPIGYYDRVYCGAAVPPEESEFMKSLIKIGGILVMPLEGSLLKVTRKNEHSWNTTDVLGVTFTNLILPEHGSFNTVTFPPVEPLSLQELCRSNVRSSMRENLQNQTPELKMRTKCNLVINPDQHFGIEDPFNQFVRIQYGGDREGLVHLQNIVDTFSGLNGSASDEASVTDDEEFMNDVNIDDSDENEEEQNIAEVMSDESSKRKSPEAGCSNQEITSTETENPKRMRMNSTTQSLPSTSSHTTSELWETISTDTTRSSMLNNDDSASWVSSIDSDEYEGFGAARDHYLNGVYQTLFDNLDDSSNESEAGIEEAASDLTKYRFISDYRFNELSKSLKETIYSLSIPTQLKLFLNYNRID